MKNSEYILAIDEGTTGSTALIVDTNLKVLASHNVEFRQIFSQPGWVEHNLDDIWKATLKAIATVIKKSKIKPQKIIAIGITNQRETACFWDRITHKPIGNAIVWQDRRTANRCEQLRQKGYEKTIQAKTGLLLDPYFSATKFEVGLTERKSKNLALGTIDSFLIFKLTNGKNHVTETSNASRTMLYNIHTLKWDNDLLREFQVPEAMLPQVKNSTDFFGVTHKVPGLPDGIKIFGALGDQQAALLGQACIEPGSAKCTYGTGSFILLNTGAKAVSSSHRLLTTIAWTMNNKTTYALEGGAFTAGAAVQWVRDGLKMIKSSQAIEKLASQVQHADGVIFVPAFTGMGAPYWQAQARAAFFGISRGTQQAHLARAVLDGIAWMNVAILKAMEQDLGQPLIGLNVDGGAAKNNLLMQIQADYLKRKLVRPRQIETTAMGAVFSAGLGAKVWKNINEIKKSWKQDQVFMPSMAVADVKQKYQQWQKAIAAVKLL